MKTSKFIHKHLWPSLKGCLIYGHIMSQLMCTWLRQKHLEFPSLTRALLLLCYFCISTRHISQYLRSGVHHLLPIWRHKPLCVSTTAHEGIRVAACAFNHLELVYASETHKWWHSEHKMALRVESPSYQGSDLMFQTGLPVKQITFIGNLCTITMLRNAYPGLFEGWQQ